MAENVYLVNCDPDDFEQSVGSPVDLDEYTDAPAALDGDAVRLWGVAEGSRNRDYFEAMTAGDLLLFYVDGEYRGTGRAGQTVEDEDGWAREELWDGRDATLLYTVEDFEPVAVPSDAVHRIFDYSGGYAPDALSRVAANRVENSLDAIELAVQRFDERND